MKKNLLTLTTLLIGSFVIGQTEEQKILITKNYDQERLAKLVVDFREEYEANYARAIGLAQKNGWETRIVKEDGTVLELKGVTEDGQPIYISTLNEGAARTTKTNELYPGGSLGLELTGEGMTVGVWEIDATRPTHELFSGRVTQVNADSWGNHANHVTGTLIGGDDIQFGARGMAYEANARAFNAVNDHSEMANEAADGLLVSNHSYGIPAAFLSSSLLGKYNTDARNVDLITYEAPYYLPVIAAGNDRDDGISFDGYDLLTDMACNKNAMTVAAVRQLLFYDEPSDVQMSPFSTWGPTDDGRIKPDISGKGVSTFSASVETNSDYYTASGTSMAAPNVAGSLILLQQHYLNVNGMFMRSSTLRGLACHTAFEAGDHPGPDYEFGWGLMNAEAAAVAITNNGRSSLIEEIILNNGETYSIQVYAADIADLHASITWTDPAGDFPGGGLNDPTPALINDLDLRISQDSMVYLPWKLDVDDPSEGATKGDNLVDNIEKVEVENSAGLYTITVTHKGNLDDPQIFSLIVTGIGDCTGALNGTAFIDSCGTCVEGTTGLTACKKDCNDDWGGIAFVDSCGVCAGGNTIYTPVLNNEICNLHESGITSDLIQVFPNPTNGQLNIHFTDVVPEDTKLRIYSPDGKIVYAFLVDDMASDIELDMSGVASGVYLVKLYTPDVTIVERIVVN